MCLEVPASSKVFLTCTAAKGRDGLIAPASLVSAFRFAVTGGVLAAPEVAVSPAALQSGSVEWTTPAEGGATASCWAVAGVDVSAPSHVAVAVVPAPPAPALSGLAAPEGQVLVNAKLAFAVTAVDPAGGELTYLWETSAGAFTGQGTPAIAWVAPATAGNAVIKVTVTSSSGGVAVDQVNVAVANSLFQGGLSTQLRKPRRVAAAPTGELAVADGVGRLHLLTRLGGLRAVRDLDEGVVTVTGAPGAFYASTTKGNILKLDVHSGKVLSRYKLGLAEGPTGLAWDAAHELLWMTHRAAGVVQAIRTDGSTAALFTTAGAARLNDVYDVAVDASTGLVWVTQDASSTGALAHAFQADGTYVRSIGGGQVLLAGGIAAAGGKVYLADAFAGQVQVLTSEGANVGAVGSFGTGPGQLRQPAGMALLSNGDLLVANYDVGRLDRFGDGTALAGCAGDTDCDGLTDAAEAAAGLDAADSTDALADADQDGLSNQDEVALGTKVFLADSDGDGLRDGDELLAGYDPLDAGDHAASLVASAPARTEPGQVKVTGVFVGSGTCTATWKQVDGPAVTLSGAATTSPTFVARAAGTYALEGVAACTKLGPVVTSPPSRVEVVVQNAVPFADAGRVAVVSPGDRVNLSAARSTDANGDRLSFSWEQTAGPAAAALAKGATYSVQPLGAGYHAFKLAARDAGGAVGEAEVPVIVVEPFVNVPTALAVSTVLTGQVGAPVALEVVSTFGTTFSWEQVSGPQASGLDAAAAATTFTPTAPGRHVFRVTAWNGGLRSAPETVQVYVAEAGAALPEAMASAPAKASVGAAVALDGGASAAGAGGALSYRWRQVSGPAAGLTNGDRSAATVVAFAPGFVEFELQVTEAGVAGVPVRVGFEALTAGRPLPLARPSVQPSAIVGELVRLDGLRSSGARSFRWTQVAGPWVQLRTNLATPTFVPPAAGQYVFELEVDDGVARSRPQQVSVLVTGEEY
ncbi:MAG: hypothetical protein IPO09_09270 [Anaeromyxobacter sp.]|nr:hypothetical protein [Anaeromyxobacter sp.]MBL0278697.1 hypothetical protein [Anaeromyxobacter sp.]